MIGKRLPPYSDDAEKAVLGSMMLDKDAVTQALPILEPDCFYNEKNKKIYQTMSLMFENNIPIDLITLSEQLQNSGELENVGGTYYLIEINNSTPTAVNVDHHSRIVKEKYLKRLMIQAAGEILEKGYDETTDALEEIDSAESKIFEIAEKRIIKNYKSLKDLSKEAFQFITHLKEKDNSELTGVGSGYNDLDSKLGGFQKSDLIIIAGRPSMGKTALALSITRNAAMEFNKPVAFFSIEMAAKQLVVRLISAEAKVNQQKIRTGRISDKELSTIIKKFDKLSKAPIFVDDSPMLNLMELRAKCRRLKTEHNIEMIIIDYLQLMHPPKAESREREISIISRSLKQMAKELDVPVVALAQLNRSVESRSDKRPLLSDLRESGSIEQDADVVLFVNRPEQYGVNVFEDKEPTEGKAEIIIGKQRNGPTGTVRLAYMKDYARFENLAYQYDEPEHFTHSELNVDPDDSPF